MKYLIGCNYWASHAGTEMWKNWDADAVEKDFQKLSQECNIHTLRVFPNWRDFQPIHIARKYLGEFREYCFKDFRPLPNAEGLDPVQMEHFRTFCKLAEKYDIKLIVGLVTGWMSGMLFVPPALEGKNIITDSECLMWQNRFVRGFVRAFKNEEAIIGWDLGNECNCMGLAATRSEAYVWSMTIANAIRVCDSTRPIISGMHSLTPDGVWTVADQAELTDILTPHPYPSVFSKQDVDALNELATTMVPTAQALYYAGLGGRPALIEEVGTFVKMLGNDEFAADFLRNTLWSGMANDAAGTLWWCAFDQEHLHYPPYDWCMVENELGLMKTNRDLKATGRELAEFANTYEKLELSELPKRQVDACCILTNEQNTLLINLATTILAKEAGFEVDFIHHDMPLPDYPLYLLPTVSSPTPMKVSKLKQILQKVEAGATLYISLDDGLLTDVENVFGARVMKRQKRSMSKKVQINTPDGDLEFTINGGYELSLEPTTADVLARDENGNTILLHNRYGKGHIYLLVAPFEKNIIENPGAFCDPSMPEYYKLYRLFSQEVRMNKIAQSKVPQVMVTQHMVSEDEAVLIAINYTAKPLPLVLDVAQGWEIEVIYETTDGIVDHNNAVVMMAQRK